MATKRAFVVLSLSLVVALGPTFATTLEEEFVLNPGWVPAVPGDLEGDIIKSEHNTWHGMHFDPGVQGREFLEFHREFLAQSDDFRISGKGVIGADPFPAAIPILSVTGATLGFDHTAYGCTRPAGESIETVSGCRIASTWYARTANLILGDPTFYGYSVNDLGVNIQTYHNEGHGSIAKHKPVDMQFQKPATKDAAFFQHHKNIDNIYADWIVGKYQGAARLGVPFFFSVDGAALGASPSSLYDRRQSDVYQGNLVPGADQYGAIPRIASDIYVGDHAADNGYKNMLYSAGTHRWNAPAEAWDVDAWTVLNLRRQGASSGWYFSVTPTSTGKVGSAVIGQTNRGGDVFEDSSGNSNVLVRTEAELGLAVSDNLDALEVDQQRRVQGTNYPDAAGVVAAGVYDRPKQWFSLRSGATASVRALDGGVLRTVDQNDILRFDETGRLVVDVAGSLLGLGASDELDALVIVDENTTNTLDAGDSIYYSLTSASPALDGLGADDSGASILCRVMGAGPLLAACGGGLVAVRATTLGLETADDVDALDLRRGGAGSAGPPGAAGLLTKTAGAANSTGLLLFDEPGACCQPNGSCVPDIAPTSCVSPNTFAGPDTSCDAARCPSAPGACCASNGTCTVVSDIACLQAAGTFRGPGTTCPPSPACPAAPANDECATATVIPYTFTSGFQPPADNTNATIPAYFQPRDPPFSCHDSKVFSGPFGSGTLWYSYTVPAGTGPRRSILVTTDKAAQFYPGGGGAGDTRMALYYAPNGNCSVLQEVACADNIECNDDPATTEPTNFYAPLRYDNPLPGRYYLQVSTTYAVQRGQTFLTVSDPPTYAKGIPALSPWGLAVMTLVLIGAGAIVLRMRARVAT